MCLKPGIYQAIEESKKLTSYYEKSEAYVKPKSNNIFARYKFHNIIQQEKKPFEQFLTCSRALIDTSVVTLKGLPC